MYQGHSLAEERRVSSGGSAVDTTIEEGLQTVLNGGNVSGTHISGGEQNISSGGSAVDTTIEEGLQTVSMAEMSPGLTLAEVSRTFPAVVVL
ncbi:hypothetical protein ACLB1S_32095 [Escherichia coli]